jgi:hypothetical protein
MLNLSKTREIAPTPDLIARFWLKVDRSGGPQACWPWTAKTMNLGYGVIWKGGKRGHTVYAHRVSCAIANGREPGNMAVCHRCDNPPCVNPNHLFLDTIKGNVADMTAKGRKASGPFRSGLIART